MCVHVCACLCVCVCARCKTEGNMLQTVALWYSLLQSVTCCCGMLQWHIHICTREKTQAQHATTPHNHTTKPQHKITARNHSTPPQHVTTADRHSTSIWDQRSWSKRVFSLPQLPVCKASTNPFAWDTRVTCHTSHTCKASTNPSAWHTHTTCHMSPTCKASTYLCVPHTHELDTRVCLVPHTHEFNTWVCLCPKHTCMRHMSSRHMPWTHEYAAWVPHLSLPHLPVCTPHTRPVASHAQGYLPYTSHLTPHTSCVWHESHLTPYTHLSHVTEVQDLCLTHTCDMSHTCDMPHTWSMPCTWSMSHTCDMSHTRVMSCLTHTRYCGTSSGVQRRRDARRVCYCLTDTNRRVC